MSGSTAVKIVIFLAVVGGKLVWGTAPIQVPLLLMQNKTIDIIITGGDAHAVGQSLNLNLPNVYLGDKVVTAAVVLALQLCGIIYIGSLVQILNAALGRNYTVKARWYKKGAGQQDDEVVFRLVP